MTFEEALERLRKAEANTKQVHRRVERNNNSKRSAE